MKTKTSYWPWDARLAKVGALIAGAWLFGTPGSLAAEDNSAKPAEAAKPADAAKTEEATEEKAATYRNWFDVSVGGLLTQGNRAEFMRRENARGGGLSAGSRICTGRPKPGRTPTWKSTGAPCSIIMITPCGSI